MFLGKWVLSFIYKLFICEVGNIFVELIKY